MLLLLLVVVLFALLPVGPGEQWRAGRQWLFESSAEARYDLSLRTVAERSL